MSYQPGPRVAKLKKTVVEAEPEICLERARIITEVYRDYEAEPVVVRRGIMLREILGRMRIYIEDGELIVGNQARAPRCAPLFPEYSWDWIWNEIDQFVHRDGDRFHLREADKAELREILQFWRGRTLKDRVYAMQPEAVLLDKRHVGVLGWEGNVTAGEGHIIVDYDAVLRQGFGGIRDRAQKRLDNLDMADPDHLRQMGFLQATVIAMDACSAFCRRYAALAREQAEAAEGPRRAELGEIAQVCDRVATSPPGSFREAIQLTWFTHLILQIETNGHSMSLGRLDQLLQPFYRRDAEAGVMDEERASELMQCMYLKMFSIIKVRPWSHTKFVAGYPTYQNIVVGGQDAHGNDVTNDMTYICLHALGTIRLSEPNFYVRIHPGTPEKLMHTCAEIIRMGFGMPALVNDEVIIPALEKRGVYHEDAANYATMGCLEVQVPGKWGYRANGKSKLNLLKVLELAIHDGRDPQSGVQLCPGGGALPELDSFDQVMDAWVRQLNYFTRLQVTADNINDLAMEELVPDVLCSALVQDCIGRGRTIKEGGAVYDMVSGCQVGVPNVGNSLYAIRQLVFQEGRITAEDLMEAISTNFAGVEGERIRQMLVNAADKYGNDQDEVDLLTKEAFDYYIRDIVRYKNTRHGRGPIGGIFMPATVTISANVPSGRACGATPDGRRAGEPTADGVSPVHGTERLGPTAVLSSVSKLSTEDTTGGQLLNMRFQPNIIRTAEDEAKFIALVKTFFEKKGWHMQFNMISTDTLRDAQAHPESYSDLVIRVAGYSALFTALDPVQQEDIIGRMEYTF